MALEVSAAIIGISAAAGKVVETLGPVVSAYKDSTKNAAIIIHELDSAKIVLTALRGLFDDLPQSSPGRRELIRVDQLVASLTAGVLLCSEIEAVVAPLDYSAKAITVRLRWAWKDKELASLVARMQRFISHMTLILNILQCENDVEARRSHQELSSAISTLLDNRDFRNRVAHLESCSNSGHSIATVRPISTVSTVRLLQGDAGAIARLNDMDLRLSTHSIDDFQQFQFERDLEGSRVYRKATSPVDEYDSRSFTVRSGAWTALSDISLSDISAISVIALPISPNDIVNDYHYVFRTPATTQEDGRRASVLPSGEVRNCSRSLSADGRAPTEVAGPSDAETEHQQCDLSKNAAPQLSILGAAPLSRLPSLTKTSIMSEGQEYMAVKGLQSPKRIEIDQNRDGTSPVEPAVEATPSAASTSLTLSPSTTSGSSEAPQRLKLVVRGAVEAETNLLISQIASRKSSAQPDGVRSRYCTKLNVDDRDVTVDIIVINEQPHGSYYWSDDREVEDGHMFMLVYSTTSISSFERLTHCSTQYPSKYKQQYPMLIVANHCSPAYSCEAPKEKGKELARRLGVKAIHVAFNIPSKRAKASMHDSIVAASSLRSMDTALHSLIRERGAFEWRQGEEIKKKEERDTMWLERHFGRKAAKGTESQGVTIRMTVPDGR